MYPGEINRSINIGSVGSNNCLANSWIRTERALNRCKITSLKAAGLFCEVFDAATTQTPAMFHHLTRLD